MRDRSYQCASDCGDCTARLQIEREVRARLCPCIQCDECIVNAVVQEVAHHPAKNRLNCFEARIFGLFHVGQYGWQPSAGIDGSFRWVEFQTRYHEEVRKHPELLGQLRSLARKSRVTLVYSADDEVHNNAVVLRNLLLGAAHPGNQCLKKGRLGLLPPQQLWHVSSELMDDRYL